MEQDHLGRVHLGPGQKGDQFVAAAVAGVELQQRAAVDVAGADVAFELVAGRGRGGPVGGEDLDQALRVLGASI
ncbi:hypothetical protein [Pseudonocardia parietis]|uniref:Uncharacterized protein n=1 Tax=Pseudonocardia parietis TaxID=570936 RepID=A0ABS4W5V7_9PSEU|nr:hypothetical protein [Pseudonocardia parietis]MBP2371571.1 hypothetical protein [Pseudonocardia parietis]